MGKGVSVALVTGAGRGIELAGFTPESNEPGREEIIYHRRSQR